LCTLALEEVAKLPIALNALFIPAEDKKAWVGFCKTFNIHKDKQNATSVYGQHILKENAQERCAKCYGDRIPEGVMLNEAKLASMYVDCYDSVTLRQNKVFTQGQG